MFSAAASYHEAGHAVARIYLGAPATDTWVFRNGSGYSDGSITIWRSGNTGVGQAWDLLVMLMAGAHAEARANKRAIKDVQLSKAVHDYAIATILVEHMAKRSKSLSIKDIWRQTHWECSHFLRHCWHTIDRVADKLMKTGYVSKAELRQMTKKYRRIKIGERPRL